MTKQKGKNAPTRQGSQTLPKEADKIYPNKAIDKPSLTSAHLLLAPSSTAIHVEKATASSNIWWCTPGIVSGFDIMLVKSGVQLLIA